jgi:hypothetical protein
VLVVDFDPDRPHATGQFHVRLIDAASGDYGNDARRQNHDERRSWWRRLWEQP